MAMPVPDPAEPSPYGGPMTDLVVPAEGVTLRPLTADWYNALVATGALEGERVELLGGELIEMSPQYPRHSWPIQELTRMLSPLMARGLAVRVQLPLHIDEVSVPEPDIAVTDPATPHEHPRTAHAVFEVADSSVRYDLRHKGPRYAAAGVGLYVVLDVADGRTVVHTDPGPQGYATVEERGVVEVLGLTLDLGPLVRPA